VKLSPNFSLAELTRSETATRLALRNVPDTAEIALLTRVCTEILEPVRACFGRPVMVSSGYRSPALNRAIPGSSATSEHCFGRAADFSVPGVSNAEVARWIAGGGLPLGFGQVILEAYTPGVPASGWVHCSIRTAKHDGKVLTMQRVRQGAIVRTVYLNGIVA
jgi:zinc D-Ala-D-Ala carboxypeptidase